MPACGKENNAKTAHRMMGGFLAFQGNGKVTKVQQPVVAAKGFCGTADQRHQFQRAAESLGLPLLQPSDGTLPAGIAAEQNMQGKAGNSSGVGTDLFRPDMTDPGMRGKSADSMECLRRIVEIQAAVDPHDQLGHTLECAGITGTGVYKPAGEIALPTVVDIEQEGAVITAVWIVQCYRPLFSSLLIAYMMVVTNSVTIRKDGRKIINNLT